MVSNKSIFLLKCITLCCFFWFHFNTINAQTAVKIDGYDLLNLYQVDKHIFRSEQPKIKGFVNLEKLGITEVLNLRRWHSDNKKAKNVALNFFNIPMRAGNIKEKDVLQALKIIKNRNGNILIHCKHGADRTGLIVAMYRIVFQNYSKEQAIQEMTEGGFGFHKMYKNIINYIQGADIESIRNEMLN